MSQPKFHSEDKVKRNLSILISELEGVEKSLRWGVAGHEQEVLGEMRLSCIMCGYCPAALVARLKEIYETNP